MRTYSSLKQDICKALSKVIVRIPDDADTFDIRFHIFDTAKQLVHFFILQKSTEINTRKWVPINRVAKKPQRPNHLNVKRKITDENSSLVVIERIFIPFHFLARRTSPVHPDVMAFNLNRIEFFGQTLRFQVHESLNVFFKTNTITNHSHVIGQSCLCRLFGLENQIRVNAAPEKNSIINGNQKTKDQDSY